MGKWIPLLALKHLGLCDLTSDTLSETFLALEFFCRDNVLITLFSIVE